MCSIPFLHGLTIDLEKIPEYPLFDNTTFTEQIDETLCNKILQCNDDRVPIESKQEFQDKIIKYLHKNELNVTYFASHGLGRRYAKYNCGLTPMSRYIKHTIFKYANWVDIDMKKSYPNILRSLATFSNIKLPAYDYYINNFDDIVANLTEYYAMDGEPRLTKDQVKWLFSIIIFGGDENTWMYSLVTLSDSDLAKGYKPVIIPKKTLPDFVEDFKSDTIRMVNKIEQSNKELRKKLWDGNKTRDENINTMISYYLGIIENHILYSSIEFMMKKQCIKLPYASFAYDGFTIPAWTKIDEMIYNIDLLNKHIRNITNMQYVEFVIKPFEDNTVLSFLFDQIYAPALKCQIDDDDDLTEDIYFSTTHTIMPLKKTRKNVQKLSDIRFANNDVEARDIIIQDLDGRLLYNKGQLFYKDGHIWTNNAELIQNKLLIFVQESNIFKHGGKDKKGNDMVSAYAQNITSAQKILSSVIAKIKSNLATDIYQKFHTTTKGKICFMDGVLDFQTKQFYSWDCVDFEYYSTIMIPRNFGDYHKNPDKAMVNKIKSTIYEPFFGDNVELGLRFLSRAIAGHNEDKNFGVYRGNRDCGKGIVFDNLKAGFGDYLNSFEILNLMYVRKTATQETSRMLYWLLDYEFTRLAISQEVPNPSTGMKVDGKQWKKLCGGGDELTARRNFDRIDTKFFIDSTFLIMGNDEVIFDEKDVKEHQLEFSSIIQFKTKEEMDYERLKYQPCEDDSDDIKNAKKREEEIFMRAYREKDPTLKYNCKNVDWANAIVYLLMQYYSDNPISVINKKVCDDEDGITNREAILQHFVLDDQDSCIPIPCKVVYEKLDISKKKIDDELDSMGVVKKKYIEREHPDLRQKTCFFGIKERLLEEEQSSGDKRIDVS